MLRFSAFSCVRSPSAHAGTACALIWLSLAAGTDDGARSGRAASDRDSVPSRLNLTILNLPGIARTAYPSHHHITYVEGDACNTQGFKERSFDVVFSNSVIEHVGPPQKQAEFAREARRLGKSYWVQTPSKWFPIEAHCGMPYWWVYPESWQKYFIAGLAGQTAGMDRYGRGHHGADEKRYAPSLS